MNENTVIPCTVSAVTISELFYPYVQTFLGLVSLFGISINIFIHRKDNTYKKSASVHHYFINEKIHN